MLAKPTVAVLGFWHETNTASPFPTSLEQFGQFELAAGDTIGEQNAGVGSVIGGFLDSEGLDLRLCFSAGAWPGGPVTEQARRHVFDRSVDELSRAGRVQGVLVNLHGAMVGEEDLEPELTLVRAVRDSVGDAPLVGVLDLHANPSPELVACFDVLISYDTYPHVDMRTRGQEAASALEQIILGGERRLTSIAKLPLLVPPLAQATDNEPMRGLQVRAQQRARSAGLDRICVVGGFAYSDVARAGMSVLVVHAPHNTAAAQSALEETVKDIATQAGSFLLSRPRAKEAVRQAISSRRRPVVLVDVADNVGGGSPGDGTELLRELLAQGATGALVVIADPEAARLAAAVGVGGHFVGQVGGKADLLHGAPIDLRGTIISITDGRYRAKGTWMTGRSFEMGTTAVIDVDGNTVVVTERRIPPFHAEQVTSQGIELAAMDYIVAKGAIAWRSAYGDVAKEVIEVATSGVCPVDIGDFSRVTLPMRYP